MHSPSYIEKCLKQHLNEDISLNYAVSRVSRIKGFPFSSMKSLSMGITSYVRLILYSEGE